MADIELLTLARMNWPHSVISATLTAPPGSPVAGDPYIVAASPTGAWAGQATKIARWSGTVWEFQTPGLGRTVYNEATSGVLRWTGAAWVDPSPASLTASIYDANTVLAADVDDTPHTVTMAASTTLARLASGNIKAASVAEMQALLSISVSGGGAITAFAWASNAATLSLLTSKNWAASNTLTGNSTITITNGVEGDYGTIYVRQDGTGTRTLTFTVAGRTILRDANAIDDNPQSFNSTITAYNYQFVTMTGGVYIRITKVFLA